MPYNSAELLENGKLPQNIQEPLKTYISEAQFFAKVVTPDLSRLSTGSQIVEIGSPAQLREQGGLYARLAALQLA